MQDNPVSIGVWHLSFFRVFSEWREHRKNPRNVVT